MKLFTYKIPLRAVKPICVGAALIGLFFAAAGRWPVALCMLLGSYLLEKNLYRCPACGKRLDMKMSLSRSSRCPGCYAGLRG